MNELEKIRNYAISFPQFKKFDQLVKMICAKFSNRPPQELANSEQLKFIVSELRKLNVEQLQKIMHRLPPQTKITALSVLREEEFSLILVIMPKGMQFNWHDHPSMIGNTRCISGKFRISAIDRTYMQHKPNPNPNFISKEFQYPRERIRMQTIDPNSYCVTTIKPHGFNIHRIEALEQSCFLDLLMPDYPDNECNSYETVYEDQNNIYIKALGEPVEDIVDLNLLIGDKKQPTQSYSTSLFDSSSSCEERPIM